MTAERKIAPEMRREDRDFQDARPLESRGDTLSGECHNCGGNGEECSNGEGGGAGSRQ